ncbi:hypothetical protein ACE38W_04535 [Chitinophaga sp. Hz27]|uniref:hypothetical protein n=1 Tax=Chitinophaga sp. Hz27 TaxID=3347169 RepID=UPI0035D5CCD6
MFRKICYGISACFLLISGNVFAQELNPEIIISKEIDEPTYGGARLLQMKNGNTLYFHFSEKEGIETIVFDAGHKQIAEAKTRLESMPKIGFLKAAFHGLFELNGKAVAFFRKYGKKDGSLYRITFDGNNGKLLEEKLIVAGNDYSWYEVFKDPASEYYGIAQCTSANKDGGMSMKLTHYSPTNEVINEGQYEVQGNWYRLLGMYVHGAEYMVASSRGWNRELGSVKLLISRLAKGSHDITTATVTAYQSTLPPETTDFKYNPVSKQLYMVSVQEIEPEKKVIKFKPRGEKLEMGTNVQLVRLNVIDPSTLKTSVDKTITHPALNTYSQTHLKHKDDYNGTIQDFQLHTDGTVSLMSEELRTVPAGNGGLTMYIGDLGIIHISEKGEELSDSYAIAKEQYHDNHYNAFDAYKRTADDMDYDTQVKRQNGYWSFNHLYLNNQLYLLFNDIRDNVTDNENYKDKSGQTKPDKTNTMLAWFDGSKVRYQYLFGESAGNMNRYSRLDLNALSPDGKSLATLMIERKGSKQEAHIVWVKF